MHGHKHTSPCTYKDKRLKIKFAVISAEKRKTIIRLGTSEKLQLIKKLNEVNQENENLGEILTEYQATFEKIGKIDTEYLMREDGKVKPAASTTSKISCTKRQSIGLGMPFGILSAPEVYQKTMDTSL
ncbi:hypothetical protein PoB_006394900 [Plakobranchus ocellatus]|uniref:Uncharacterized protein n=1 Tax=Plakobranchus ocellatus TaxID=259542 RepID=A0AAV4D052_9GAST|nr:hypothetical protein PoB_006394900 [Plakobranchus ocellatus]